MTTYVLILWVIGVGESSTPSVTQIDNFPTLESCEYVGRQWDKKKVVSPLRDHLCLEVKK